MAVKKETSMEDILQFLVIASVIVVGIVRQFKKEAKKNADNRPAMPMPKKENSDNTMPVPESWRKTYGGYIPEGPAEETNPVPTMKREVTQKHKYSPSSKSFLPGEPARTSSYSPVVSPEEQNPPPPSISQSSDIESEYSIQSAEEARKAIVWSEILQRKY